MDEDGCLINSTDINYLPEVTNSQILTLQRWYKFCKVVYVENCNLDSLSPPLTNIQKLLENSTYDDCFSTRNLIIYCISMILSVVIILTNGLVILAFVRSRNLLTSTNIPILSLTFSDFLTGVSFMYSTTWNFVLLSASYKFDFDLSLSLILRRSNKYLCLTFDGTGVLFTCMMSSVLTLGVIAAQRYIAVFYSYKFPTWMTTPKMVVAVIGIWIISLVVGILPVSGWNTWRGNCQLADVVHFSYIILWSTICFASGTIMLFLYIRIFLLTRKHVREIKSTRVTSTSSCTVPISVERVTHSIKQNDDVMASEPTRQEPEEQARKERVIMTPKTPNNVTMIDVKPATPCDVGVTVESPSIPNNIKNPDNHSPLLRRHPSNNISEDMKPQPPDMSPRVTSHSFETPVVPMKPKEIKHIVSKRKRKRNSSASEGDETGRRQKLRRPSRAVVTTAMILGAFYICWTPFLVYLLAFHRRQDNLLTYYLAVVTQINSVFNPITYSIRNRDIKAAIKKLFKCQRSF